MTVEKVEKEVSKQYLGLNNQRHSIEVDVAGGRVMSFCLDGKNHLAEKALFPGSTIWTSPQSDWDWPPSIVLDSQNYQLDTHTESVLMLSSEVCPQLNVSMVKTFSSISGGFRVEVEIHNAASYAQQYAPWQVTRVLGGDTYFRSASGITQNTGLELDQKGGSYRYRHNPALLEAGQKCFANESSGWIANVNEGLLFVKRFSPIPSQNVAPGEGELEVYAFDSEDSPYVEVEVQGAYEAIPAGAAAKWGIDWLLVEAPSELSSGAGEEADVEGACRIIEALVQGL